MTPQNIQFAFCPACGTRGIEFSEQKLYRCPKCNFQYFHNVATAVGLILEVEDNILFTVRAMQPSKGLLGLPGGFVNPGERAEDAVLRECREEIGWQPESFDFFASFPNTYTYKNVLYNTCDFYFTAKIPFLDQTALSLDKTETASIRLIPKNKIDPTELAFDSLRRVISAYCQR